MNEAAIVLLSACAIWFIITVGRQLALHRSIGEQSYSRMLFDAVIALIIFIPLALAFDGMAFLSGGFALILGDVITLYPRRGRSARARSVVEGAGHRASGARQRPISGPLKAWRNIALIAGVSSAAACTALMAVDRTSLRYAVLVVILATSIAVAGTVLAWTMRRTELEKRGFRW